MGAYNLKEKSGGRERNRKTQYVDTFETEKAAYICVCVCVCFCVSLCAYVCVCVCMCVGGGWGNTGGEMFKMLDFNIVVSEFEFLSNQYVLFRNISLEKGMEPFIPLSMD